MSIVLSFAESRGRVWAAGPEGLFELSQLDSPRQSMEPVLQPMQHLYCCAAIHDRLMVGGLPHGVAYSVVESGQLSDESGGGGPAEGPGWQAGWMDNVDAPVLSLAPDPMVINSGVILAGTDSGGILRTTNRGGHWYTRNFGLHTFTILSLVWAPVAPEGQWPAWQMVFATTEEGIYHSPNGGRGWKRSESRESVYQALAIAPDYHASGLVLAGTEGDGLYRSTDGGHSFEPVPDSPRQVNALAAARHCWYLSDEQQVWQSTDGLAWTPVEGSQPALVFHVRRDQVLAGHESGVTSLPVAEPVAG